MTFGEQLSETEFRAYQIFAPDEVDGFLKASNSTSSFVHYSSAEAAMNILRSREIWMRKPSLMNDFMEFDYGRELLVDAYRSEGIGVRFRTLLDKMFPGFCDELEEKFDGWLPHFRNNTYILCISEHLQEEDQIGRLSMWRAYGGGTGVAMVMKNTPFVQVTNKLAAYSSPVCYVNKESFAQSFERIVQSIDDNFDFVKSLSRETVLNYVFAMMRTKVLCTKHPGFHEEKEWRIYYSPEFQKSETIKPDLQIIAGVPQTIQKVPLQNDPDAGLVGADVPNLIDHLIIGPTEYTEAIYEAFREVLRVAGVENPAGKISISDIPLRR